MSYLDSWREQLYICSDKEKQKGMCNCTMCPSLHKHFELNFRYIHNYCTHMKGKIRDPEICWCRSGIAFMWMAQAAPSDTIEMLSKIG